MADVEVCIETCFGILLTIVVGGLSSALIACGNSARIDNTCLAAPYLPVWMVVSGSISLLFSVILAVVMCCMFHGQNNAIYAVMGVVMITVAISGVASVASVDPSWLGGSVSGWVDSEVASGSGMSMSGEPDLDMMLVCEKKLFKQAVAACVLYVLVALPIIWKLWTSSCGNIRPLVAGFVCACCRYVPNKWNEKKLKQERGIALMRQEAEFENTHSLVATTISGDKYRLEKGWVATGTDIHGMHLPSRTLSSVRLLSKGHTAMLQRTAAW